MHIKPQNNYVLCKQCNKTTEKSDGLIVYEKENMPIYKIYDIADNLKTDSNCMFTVGLEIICNSTGTKAKIDNDIWYLFNIENIVGIIS